ncbi:SKP1-interacting partner 15-like [Curcuma longa]|uniref:SKP1-interacting partner 15-like n=1 Tax=Curcuma longa TaxID=136217 RepID=UPI003D9DEF26
MRVCQAAGEEVAAGAEEEEEEEEAAAACPIQLLPQDALHNVLGRLPLHQALACRPVSRVFLDALSSPPFLSSLPSLRLLALRHPRAASAPHPSLHAFDPALRRWLRLPLSFLPFPSASPVTASPSLLYLWVDTAPFAPAADAAAKSQTKSLVVCNPLSGSYRLLPPLGSAWSRHGTVIAGPGGSVVIVTELAALSYAPSPDRWLKFPLSLPSKPRSPIMMSGSVFALCDVGAPWRSQWKLFCCSLADLGRAHGWAPIERHEWGDVFDIFKRPRLLAGAGGRQLLMIGGLRSSFVLDAPCSTVLILRLDLDTMEWDEAGRMPLEMYRCFGGGFSSPLEVVAAAAAAAGANNKVKVFGGDGKVWFSGKRVRGKLAMWEEGAGKSDGGLWSWVDGIPGYPEGMYRGFLFDAGFTSTP